MDLWAKIYLLEQLSFLEKRLSEDLKTQIQTEVSKQSDQIKTEVSKQSSKKIEIARLDAQLNEFYRQRNRIALAEASPEINL